MLAIFFKNPALTRRACQSRSFRTTAPAYKTRAKHFGAFSDVVSTTEWEELKKMDFHQLEEWCENNTHVKHKKNKIPEYYPKKKFFKDSTRLHVRAGSGGSGCVTFQREPNKRIGPPSGGSGGDGGSVIIRCVEMEPNLYHLKHFHGAPNGAAGMKDLKRGKNGATLFLDVPIGTVITQYFPEKSEDISEAFPDDLEEMDVIPNDLETALREQGIGQDEGNDDEEPFLKKMEKLSQRKPSPKTSESLSQDELFLEKEVHGVKSDEGDLCIELVRPGEYFVAAKGGRGGSGNKRFASGGNRSPKQSTSGEPGDDRWFKVELKMIAQIGLVGFPNAGKSSFLAAISNATPKIANYPFTTLSPSIGTLQWVDSFSLSMADLPGIIEGAHMNRGLGHEFLKHIERTRVICFVLDMSNNPWDHFQILRDELKEYRSDLLGRAAVIIANKMDLEQSQAGLASFTEQLQESDLKGLPIFPISALEVEGIQPVKDYFRTFIEQLGTNEGFERPNFVAVDLSDKFQKMLDASHERESDE